jgi:Zn ribbon nucleic-acid-binding protein
MSTKTFLDKWTLNFCQMCFSSLYKIFIKYTINYTKLYKKDKHYQLFVLSNGASCHGASCPWGEFRWGKLSMGRVVHGASCPWCELYMERVVHGASCLWGEMTVGRVVMGRVWMGRVVRGASIDGASCPRTCRAAENMRMVAGRTAEQEVKMAAGMPV